MANKKISELDIATGVKASDLIAIVQDNKTVTRSAYVGDLSKPFQSGYLVGSNREIAKMLSGLEIDFREVEATWRRGAHWGIFQNFNQANDIDTFGIGNNNILVDGVALGASEPVTKNSDLLFTSSQDTIFSNGNAAPHVFMTSRNAYSSYNIFGIMSAKAIYNWKTVDDELVENPESIDFADDDVISFVIGSLTDSAGEEHTLSLLATAGGVNIVSGGKDADTLEDLTSGSLATISLVVDFMKPSQQVIVAKQYTSKKKWENFIPDVKRAFLLCEFNVTRMTDSISISAVMKEDETDLVSQQQTITDLFSFNYSASFDDMIAFDHVSSQSKLVLSQFKNASAFGFGSMSNAKSKFSNVTFRPGIRFFDIRTGADFLFNVELNQNQIFNYSTGVYEAFSYALTPNWPSDLLELIPGKYRQPSLSRMKDALNMDIHQHFFNSVLGTSYVVDGSGNVVQVEHLAPEVIKDTFTVNQIGAVLNVRPPIGYTDEHCVLSIGHFEEVADPNLAYTMTYNEDTNRFVFTFMAKDIPEPDTDPGSPAPPPPALDYKFNYHLMFQPKVNNLI